MPYSFTKIERDKSRTVGLVFSFLIFFYFFSALFIYGGTKFFLVHYLAQGSRRPLTFNILSMKEIILILGFASVAAAGHWLVTMSQLIPKLLGALKAEFANPRDSYHKMFRNIVDEVSVATGGMKMEAVVVPTLAMNAFALSDMRGRHVIGVTEGLLTRCNRSQVEAIVGHEAAHVVSGDCLSTTIITSLFELYRAILEGLKGMLRGSTRSYYGRRGGGGIALLFIVYALVYVTHLMGTLLRMFVSREKEYRADAVAVRLTRNPLALAEGLYAIANRWRGSGLSGANLEAIFIISPKHHSLEEQEGMFANLFSTHPPIQKRIDILLNMAHADVSVLEISLRKQKDRPKQMAPEKIDQPLPTAFGPKEWLIHRDGQWLGPFPIDQILTLQWLKPDMWVKPMGGKNIAHAFEDPDINRALNKKDASSSCGSDCECPKCRLRLSTEVYEGLEIYRCHQCHGVLVKEQDVQKILIREDYDFSQRIKELAEKVKKESELFSRRIDLKGANLHVCPVCRHRKAKMVRMFYSGQYKVEIDKCIFCGYVWFDNDELEILQCLVESAVKNSTVIP